MSNISTQQARTYAQAAGFSGSALDMIVAIATCESGLDPSIRGKSDPRDRGIVQINSYWHPEVSDACAFNPQCAMQQAYRISKGGTDFSQWTTYKNGCASGKLGASIQASGTPTSTTADSVSSALSSLPFGLGSVITSVQTTFVNAVEEIGIFLLAIIIIVLGVIILNTDEIQGLSHKVLA